MELLPFMDGKTPSHEDIEKDQSEVVRPSQSRNVFTYGELDEVSLIVDV